MGTKALATGDVGAAIQQFSLQAGYAELADIDLGHARGKNPSYPLAIIAYNNLALAFAVKGDYLRAKLWSLVALRWDKENKDALSNLEHIEEKLKDWKWPKTPEGEYLQYAGRGDWDSIIVEPSPPDKVHFCFSGLWWGLGEGPSGLGELTATIPLHDGQAEYTSREFTGNKCLISIHFYPDRLEVKQTGTDFDCGFGHNVMAAGTFQRIGARANCPTGGRQ